MLTRTWKPVPLCLLLLAFAAQAASPPAAQVLQSDEADLVLLYGDMDNLGFGWPQGFDVFSGKNTPSHNYPWPVKDGDAPGTDRIMLGSGYQGRPPHGSDGYTGTTRRPGNSPEALQLRYDLQGQRVNAATLQMFVDDFQTPVWKGNIQVTLNGKRAPFLEEVLNVLNQTGPIGKLITARIPQEFLGELAGGKLDILIDDPSTGAGDGYAVDFVRLLINPRAGQYKHLGTLTGKVTDMLSGQPLAGATVFCAGVETSTDDAGHYTLERIPAGLATVTAAREGYIHKTSQVDLISGYSARLDLALTPGQDPGASTIRR